MEKKKKNQFDFWQDHSISYLEMAFNTDRHGTLDNPDGYGKKTGDCGDTVEFFLIVDKETIKHISFRIDGCRNTNACANAIAHLMEEKDIKEAWDLTPNRVIEFLETLPSESHHCAELAIGSFYLALSNYHELKKNKWKKLYQ